MKVQCKIHSYLKNLDTIMILCRILRINGIKYELKGGDLYEDELNLIIFRPYYKWQRKVVEIEFENYVGKYILNYER